MFLSNIISSVPIKVRSLVLNVFKYLKFKFHLFQTLNRIFLFNTLTVLNTFNKLYSTVHYDQYFYDFSLFF